MSDRTLGQKVNQWITNIKLIIPMFSLLGLSSIYGNSETVKDFIHGSPPIVIEKVTSDPRIDELIEANSKEIENLKRWHER